MLAIACAAQGATVVLHGRVVRKLEALYDDIVNAGYPEPTILPLDLATARAEDFANVASALQAQHGRVDAIVHTAVQLGSLGPIEHQAFDAWLATVRVDLLAPFGLTRALLPLLRAAPEASVAFTLDTRGEEPKAFWGAYAVAKAGLSRLARDPCRRMGKRAQSARQRHRPRADALAAARTDASGRRHHAPAAARSLRAAVSPFARRSAESRKRQGHRRRRRGCEASRPSGASVSVWALPGSPCRSSTRRRLNSSAGIVSGQIASARERRAPSGRSTSVVTSAPT